MNGKPYNDYLEEVWDDSQLVKAYDKAMNKAKQVILKKLQGEMYLSNEEIQKVFGDVSSFTNEKKKRKKSPPAKSKWKVGSVCRAIYSEDGQEYEAEIIKVIDFNRCIVRFFGYNNEQEVLLKELTPSQGKKMIEVQICMADTYNATLEESGIDSTEQDESSNPLMSGEASSPVKTGRRNVLNSSLYYTSQRVPKFNRFIPPPSPPPIPPLEPASFNRFANTAAGASIPQLSIGDETLSMMLLSWYMCGYYTRCYEQELQEQHTPSSRHKV